MKSIIISTVVLIFFISCAKEKDSGIILPDYMVSYLDTLKKYKSQELSISASFLLGQDSLIQKKIFHENRKIEHLKKLEHNRQILKKKDSSLYSENGNYIDLLMIHSGWQFFEMIEYIYIDFDNDNAYIRAYNSSKIDTLPLKNNSKQFLEPLMKKIFWIPFI